MEDPEAVKPVLSNSLVDFIRGLGAEERRAASIQHKDDNPESKDVGLGASVVASFHFWWAESLSSDLRSEDSIPFRTL